MKRTRVLIAALVLAGGFGALQFIQPDKTNPPFDPNASFSAVAGVPAPVTAAVERACADCHSNQTRWPWYSRISPVSWLVARDVRKGRTHLNLSEWNRYGAEMSRLRLGEMCEVVRSGKMPLWQYTLLHREARLASAEVSALCAAPQAMATSRLTSRAD